MNRFATLLIRAVSDGGGYFDFLLEKGIAPEVGMEHGGLEYPLEKHRELAARLKDRGLGAAVHLPFFGLFPGAADAKTRRRAVDKLLRAAEIAAVYEAAHLIGHPEFIETVYPDYDPRADREPDEAWLERSAASWEEVLKATGARLYLENTDDQSPRAILALLKRLPERAALCFDVGHWHYAAGGRDRKNLPEWLNPIAASGRLGHLHLHDNDGDADRHWALGRGGIDFVEFFALLKERGLAPDFTLESHSLSTLKGSLAWLEQHQEKAD